MGNSASALPYQIGKQVSATNDVNGGWALHEGNRKSDGSVVTVFVCKKPAAAKRPVNMSAGLSQLATARHHFQYCKKLRHPHILTVHATLDTDNPKDATSSDSGGAASASSSAVSSGSAGSSGGGKVETGDLIIVTEPCIPLDAWLQSNPPPEQVAWGLESAVRSLHFLHASAGLAHGDVSPGSFYVTPAGDVKLWNFSIVTATASPAGASMHFRECEAYVTPAPYRSPERNEGRWEAIMAAGTHAMDSYGLGVLIGHMFGGTVPGPLVKAVQRLQTPNLKMRPRLQPLLKCPLFDTPYQKLQLQLEEFTVQPVEQKVAFWQNMLPTLQAGLVPSTVGVHKLLPLMKISIETICNSDSMKSQDLYRREIASILPPMFLIAEHFLDKEQFAKEMTTIVATLFNVADRGIRGVLLQKAPVLAERLDVTSLNAQVFEPMCSGFSDSSAPLRELTLKACAVLMPHLTDPNLEKLSRYLVRLQSDAEPTIRTNTCYFFAQLAPHLTDTSRQKLLLPAYIRAMKDAGSTATRLAALQSTSKTKEFFDPSAVAARVLPAVTPQLLDPSEQVRREAFAVVDDLLFVLRRESERLSTEAATRAAANAAAGSASTQTTGGIATTTAPSAPSAVPGATAAPAAAAAPAPKAPSSGGYFFSSWMSSSSQHQQQQPPVAGAASTAQAGAVPMGQPQPPPAAPLPQQMGNLSLGGGGGMANPAAAVSNFDDDLDGWDDDDDDLDDLGPPPAAPGPMMASSHAAVTDPAASAPGPSLFGAASNAGGDDDFFGDAAFEAKPALRPVVAAAPRPTGAAGRGGRLVVPSKTRGAAVTTARPASSPAAKPAVTKLSVEDSLEDGWDDF